MAIPHSITSESELVAGIRAGNEAAFQKVFREHYNGLCGFAARVTGSRAAAEEAVQDVFLRIWQRHEEWEVRGTLAAYLYAAVRNRSLNHLRSERMLQRWREEEVREAGGATGRTAVPGADERAGVEELARAIDRVIEELPPRCREAFLLRRQHELSYAQIAEVMGIAPKTVEIQIGAALKALRRKLAEWL